MSLEKCLVGFSTLCLALGFLLVFAYPYTKFLTSLREGMNQEVDIQRQGDDIRNILAAETTSENVLASTSEFPPQEDDEIDYFYA